LIRARWVAFSLLVLLAGGPAARGAVVDYLYVQSNVGTASGGHVAIRFGDDVYHYQNAGDDSLRLVREDFDSFRYAYSVLQNRTIHVSRLVATDDTYQRLQDRFSARHLIEQAHFDRLRARRNDVELIERILARQRGTAEPRHGGLQLRGAGFFYGDRAPSPAVEAPRLATLRARVHAARGPDFLAERSQRVDRELARLAPEVGGAAPVALSKDRLPASDYTFSQRFVDLAAQKLALDALDQARPLRRELRRTALGADLALAPDERAALAAFAGRLEANLVALVASRRPDWGYALLVGMARLLVLDESVRTGRLVVLDAFPRHALTIPATSFPGRAEFLAELRQHARGEFLDARASTLPATELRERDYNRLEDAANRYLEVRRGLDEGRDVRVYGERLIPHVEIDPPEPLLPDLDGDELLAAHGLARTRERATAQALDALYRYDLIHRNCVSEIFETINTAFSPAELRQRFGGRVEATRSFNFIPFVAYDTVNREYPVTEIAEIPSYRRTRLAQMYARENRIKVYLREANTLTSSVYRSNPQDSFFLFFTDDALLPRPVYGALNLVAGLGEAALGLLRLPFDGGRGVVAGAEGVLFSLPELAFFNVRKGSLEYGRSSIGRTRLRAAPAASR
jgi:hypothetical protein